MSAGRRLDLILTTSLQAHGRQSGKVQRLDLPFKHAAGSWLDPATSSWLCISAKVTGRVGAE
jgi:hypothetical protein